jgi:hypothetical protein
MYHVPFVCPECEYSELAPLSGVVEGDAGVWICDGCGSVYQINVEFSRLDPPRSNYCENRITDRRLAVNVN